MEEKVLYLDQSDIDSLREDIQYRLIPRTYDLIGVTEELRKLENRNTEFLDRYAYIGATSVIGSELRDIVNMVVQEACIETEEYNYDLYVEKLLEAIDYNFYDIISFTVVGDLPEIIVDFSPLGDPGMWFTAVDSVKNARNFGLTRDAETRSRMWKEKIYGTGREGKKIIRKYYKKNKSTGKKEVSGQKDITERYSHKYRETIAARLATLPSNKAPFWYFIEYGNTSFYREGTPYPELYSSPTSMARRISIEINNMYYDTYYNFRAEAEKILEDIINKEEVEEKLADDLNNYDQEELSDDYAYKVKEVYDAVDKTYRIIEKGGLPYVEARRGGRYTAIPDEIKQAAKEARKELKRKRGS